MLSERNRRKYLFCFFFLIKKLIASREKSVNIHIKERNKYFEFCCEEYLRLQNEKEIDGEAKGMYWVRKQKIKPSLILLTVGVFQGAYL